MKYDEYDDEIREMWESDVAYKDIAAVLREQHDINAHYHGIRAYCRRQPWYP